MPSEQYNSSVPTEDDDSESLCVEQAEFTHNSSCIPVTCREVPCISMFQTLSQSFLVGLCCDDNHSNSQSMVSDINKNICTTSIGCTLPSSSLSVSLQLDVRVHELFSSSHWTTSV